jgi:hypothetical protein
VAAEHRQLLARCPNPLAGVREPHEPHRFLAVQALAEMMQQGQGRLAGAVPACVAPLRLALNTLEPSLAGTAMLLLQRWAEPLGWRNQPWLSEQGHAQADAACWQADCRLAA